MPDLRSVVQEIFDNISLTQQQIADAIGVTQPFIHRIKTGKNLPSLETLAKLAELAGGEVVIEFKKKKKRKI